MQYLYRNERECKVLGPVQVSGRRFWRPRECMCATDEYRQLTRKVLFESLCRELRLNRSSPLAQTSSAILGTSTATTSIMEYARMKQPLVPMGATARFKKSIRPCQFKSQSNSILPLIWYISSITWVQTSADAYRLPSAAAPHSPEAICLLCREVQSILSTVVCRAMAER